MIDTVYYNVADIAKAYGITVRRVTYIASKFNVKLKFSNNMVRVHSDDLPRLHKAIHAQDEIKKISEVKRELGVKRKEVIARYKQDRDEVDKQIASQNKLLNKLFRTKV